MKILAHRIRQIPKKILAGLELKQKLSRFNALLR
jgi:hypothetical protein